MLITQRSAIKMLREGTGMSLKACQAAVRNMPQKVDGARSKVSKHAVRRAITEMSQLPTPPDIGIRPLSARHKAIARATAITRNAIQRLEQRNAA